MTERSVAKKATTKKATAKKATAKKTTAKKASSASTGRPVDDAEALEGLAARAQAGAHNDRFAAFFDDIGALARMVVAYARGEYTEVPADKLALMVAGLLYVASPWGLVPRLLGGLGLGQVLRSLHDDLDRFRAWEAARG